MKKRRYQSLDSWARSTLKHTVELWTRQRKLKWKLRWQVWSAEVPETVSGWCTTYCYVHLVDGYLYITEFQQGPSIVRLDTDLKTAAPERHAALLEAILFYGQR